MGELYEPGYPVECEDGTWGWGACCVRCSAAMEADRVGHMLTAMSILDLKGEEELTPEGEERRQMFFTMAMGGVFTERTTELLREVRERLELELFVIYLRTVGEDLSLEEAKVIKWEHDAGNVVVFDDEVEDWDEEIEFQSEDVDSDEEAA
jgi:hypothetical protein